MFSRLVFLAASLCAIVPLRAQTAPTTLSLEEALTSAEQANLSVLIGRESVAQAQAQATQQRATLLPRVSLDAQQRRTQSVTVSQGVPAVVTPTNRFDGKLVGSFSVLNPAQIAAFRAARKGVDVAESDYLQTVQSSLAAVAQTYFTHLRNLQRISVLDANIGRARALLDLAERQLAAGVATQIDVTRAEAQLAQAEQARLQQNTVVKQSELQLRRSERRASPTFSSVGPTTCGRSRVWRKARRPCAPLAWNAWAH
jgi:outer membrane protein TolC